MGTRSRIAIKAEGGYKSIYCHWDGYPSNNGKILLNHFKTEKKILELISLGNISVLAKKLSPNKNQIHNFDKRAKDTVLAYKRDRNDTCDQNEQGLFTKGSKNKIPMNMCEEWIYVFVNEKWLCSQDKKKWFTIEEALVKEAK